MKRAFLILLTLLLLPACAEQAQEEPDLWQAVETETPVFSDEGAEEGDSIHNLPRGCYVMKKINEEEFDCFGCIGERCKDEDRSVWEYTDQDAAAARGYFCEAASEGCEIRREQ